MESLQNEMAILNEAVRSKRTYLHSKDAALQVNEKSLRTHISELERLISQCGARMKAFAPKHRDISNGY